tara:strand:+ start:5480 stop:6661 length:1182 start_codon:yes stop_codon:yes gene_type:complete
MAFYNLDKNGKRSSRSKAAKRSKGRHTFYHYEIVVWKTVQGKRKQLRRRGWYLDDGEAEDAELKLKDAPLTEGATWSETSRAFMEAFNGKRSPIYLRDIGRALNRFIDLQGDQPVASTQIADVVPLFDSLKSRAAQTAHTALNRVGKWLRSRGEPGEFQFLHAPKPEHNGEGRQAATPEQFMAIYHILPEEMKHLWFAIGMTGSRFTAMAEVTDDDIDGKYITTISKNSKEIKFRITPEVKSAIDAGRAYRVKTSKYIWPNQNGREWSSNRFCKRLTRRTKSAEVVHVTPHQLRHMFGTVAAELNYSPDMIQAAMGHDTRASAEVYVDHHQRMADEVSKSVSEFVTQLSQLSPESVSPSIPEPHIPSPSLNFVTCPCCNHKFIPDKKKASKSG